MAWEPAERVQKNSRGEYRAMIGGEWVPVTAAQKNASGQFRVDRGAGQDAVAAQPLRNDMPDSIQPVKKSYNSNMAKGEQPGPDMLHQIVRGGSLIGRDMVTAGLSIPAMVGDLVVGGVNVGRRVAGAEPLPSVSENIQRTLDYGGAAKPANAQERILSSINRGAIGALSGAGAANALAGATTGVTRGVAKTLASNPGAQLVAGGAAGLSSQSAAEAGAGPGGQMLAGLAGGLAGGISARNLDAPTNTGALPAGAATTAREATAIRNPRLGVGGSSAGTAEYRAAVNTLQKAGIDLTKGQVSGTKWVKGLERDLSAIPLSGKPLQSRFEAQQQQYQKALLSKAGNTRGDSMITRQTLENTADDLSKRYTEALSGKSVSLGSDDFLDDLAAVEAKHSSFVDDPTKARVRRVVTEFLDKAESGDVTGEWYQSQRSIFANRAKGTGELAPLYGDLKSVLDDAFTRAAGGAKGDLDSQYARYKQLRTIWERNGGPQASEGFISPVAVAREAAGSPGGKSWQDFTRAGAAVIPDALPNSGTAARQQALKMLSLSAAGGSVPAAFYEPTALLALLGGAATTGATSAILSRGAKQAMAAPAQNPILPLLYPSIQGSQ